MGNGHEEITVYEENFRSLRRILESDDRAPRPPSVFQVPGWLECWWKAFGDGSRPFVLSAHRAGRVSGWAAFRLQGNSAAFMGSPDVCDYMDISVLPGDERDICRVLIQYLFDRGVNSIYLESMRDDSATLAGITAASEELGAEFTISQDVVTVEMALPKSWPDYLDYLGKKQRHEVRRKCRRLAEAGPYRYRVLAGTEGLHFLPRFLDLFRQHPHKADFLQGKMQQFFPDALETALDSGHGYLGVLEMDGSVAAAVFYFDYLGRRCLYNSAYTENTRWSGAGMVCKILSIRDAVESGIEIYDFLKGPEAYKYRLGGRERILWNCRIDRPGVHR